MPDASTPHTVPELLQASAARTPNEQALGVIRDGRLAWRTWADIERDATRMAVSLRQAGLQPGDRAAQISANSYGWIIADLAMHLAGVVHVPIHTTLSIPQIAEQVEHCEAKLVVVDSRQHADDLAGQAGIRTPITTHAELLTPVSEFHGLPADSTCQPDSLATILYTSGTTGEPRGVMLSQRNLVANAIATTEAIATKADDLRVGFLPLSHIFARTCDFYCWLFRGSRLVLAENRDTILRDCQLARPTVLNGVPYFFQKVAQQLQQADKTHLPGKLLELFGGRLEQCFCGGAGAAPDVEGLFADQGLPLLGGYGLTEASPVVTVTTTATYRPGRVGRALSNLEVRLAPECSAPEEESGPAPNATVANADAKTGAVRGEVLVRGPSVMLGYWRNQQATRDAIRDGWLHTGDLGEFDSDGSLKLVGRKKEILVLSTGKNVSPALVEQLLVGSPLVDQACVVGDGRKHLAALVVPNPEALRQEIGRLRLSALPWCQTLVHPRILELFRQQIDHQLANAGRQQQIGAFVLLDRPFSVEMGELTPKLSLRRDRIASNFATEIETMYQQVATRSVATTKEP